MLATTPAQYEQQTGAPAQDGLTGLVTHGYFQIALDGALAAGEASPPFSVALLDIDYFSDYNKQHGFLAGDLALQQVAAILRQQLAAGQLAARYCGDQFAVILPGLPLDEAVRLLGTVLEKIRAAFNGSLLVSAGIARFPGDGTTREDLLKRAKEALSHAKLDGLTKVIPFAGSDLVKSTGRPKVLLVDDEVTNLKLLDALLRPLNYEIFKAVNGREALEIVKEVPIDLLLLDIMMPVMNGFEVCRRLKSNEATRMIPIIMVTALDEMEAKIKGIEVGADDFLTKPPNKLELLARTKSLIRVKKLNDNLTSIENVLTSLANVVEAKDIYTKGHVQRVARLAMALGRKLGLAGQEIEALKLGGILHDIGKIAIPVDILNKPGALTAQEWQLMMTHANVGYNVCLPLKKTLGVALEVIRGHHEKLDGSGYPDGLAGDEISVAARIMAVVDIYDALISDRPYRKALSRQEAMAILKEKATRGLLDENIVAMLAELVAKEEVEDV